MTAAIAARPEPLAPTTRSPRWRTPALVLTLLAVAQFIDVLDVTIVNVALPHVQRDFHFGGNDLQWVVSIYVLFYGGFLLLGGRVADMFGRRRVFMTGLVLFGAASLGAGLAPNAGALVGVRAAQGLGAALMAPAALSLLTVAFPAGRQRDIAMGIWGGLAGLGGTLGVIIGGLLVDSLSWRWIFLVNVPIVIALVALSPLVLTESSGGARSRGSVDWAGAVLGTGGLLALVLGVIRTDAAGWGSAQVIALLVAAGALLTTFVAVERRAAQPMLPLPLFRSRSLRLGSSMLALNGAGFLAMFFLTAVYLQQVRHDSALMAGMHFLPMGIAAILSAVIAGQIVTRVGTRAVQIAGTVLALAGLALLAASDRTGSYATALLPGFVVFGAGIIAIGVPTQIAAVADTRHDTAGISSGVIGSAYQIGSALGLAVITTITTSSVMHGLAAGDTASVALTNGWHLGMVLAAGLAVVNAGIALVSPTIKPTPEMVAAAAA
jgi:EmrB/QacA subfamily drug resistance transporter